MDPIEIIGFVFGVLTVWLSTREHIATWPTALVNTAFYFVIFARAGIYANAGLQIVYFSLSCYGWYAWKYGGAAHTPLVVTRVTRRHVMLYVPLALAATLAFGFTLSRVNGAALPWVDAATTATSIVAQWMMTRKQLENWLVWNVVNVAYVAMCLSQELFLTAALYTVYLVLATIGFFSWRASLRASLRAESAPA